MIAQNGSGFDTTFALNKLPQWRTVVSSIKNGAGIVSLKALNGSVDQNKKNPQCVPFSCGRVHINKSLQKIGVSNNLQPSLLKQEMDHDETYEDTRERKKTTGCVFLKTTSYQLVSVIVSIRNGWKN